MKNIVFLKLTILFLTVMLFLFFYFNDYMPPKSSLKTARIISCLPLSENDIKIEKFLYRDNIKGDDLTYIVSKILNKKNLAFYASQKKYSILPVDENLPFPEENGQIILKYLNKKKKLNFDFVDKNFEAKGFYKLIVNNNSFDITIIDLSNNYLYIYSINN